MNTPPNIEHDGIFLSVRLHMLLDVTSYSEERFERKVKFEFLAKKGAKVVSQIIIRKLNEI